MARIQFRSPPALKAWPCAPRMMARTSPSRAMRSKVCVNSRMVSSLKALRTSGRLSQMWATGPWGRMSRVLMAIS